MADPKAFPRMAGPGLVLCLALLVGLAGSLPSVEADAAELTDVLDAFDGPDPFDFAMRLRFLSDTRTSTVARQVKCLAGDAIGGQVCPDASGIVLAKELAYERVRNVMAIDARFGLYKDMEVYLSLPIVLWDQWQHDFADGVTKENSTIRTPTDNESLFAIDYASNQRSGLGDMQLGLRWAPFNWYRDATEPSWVIGVDYTLPTGTPMTAQNDTVGYGLSELQLYTTISRRTLRMLEPYFHLRSIIRFGSQDGLFVSHGQTQTQEAPGAVIGTQVGLSVLPWENNVRDERVEIEGGFGMDYVFRGREYTEVWEALASPSNPCQASQGCTNTLNTKSALDASGQMTQTDGITDVEAYGRFAGWVGVHYQPVKFFQVSGRLGWVTETPHFITYGDYGKNLDSNPAVEQSNKQGQNEYSPTFLPSVDTPGSRLRVQDVSTFGLMLSIQGKL